MALFSAREVASVDGVFESLGRQPSCCIGAERAQQVLCVAAQIRANRGRPAHELQIDHHASRVGSDTHQSRGERSLGGAQPAGTSFGRTACLGFQPTRGRCSAAVCAAWDVEHLPRYGWRPDFAVGGVYRDDRGARIAVLGVSLSLEGLPVITAQRIAPIPGAVLCFRADDAEANRWERVQ